MISILALDPGVTTGIAKCRIVPNTRATLLVDQRVLGLYEMMQYLLDFRENDDDMHIVVYEDFVFRSGVGTGAELMPVKLQGIIEMFGEAYAQSVELWKQQPSTQGKTAFWTNDKLKEYGLYVKGKEHGRSATKHLLHFLTFGAGAQYFDINSRKMRLIEGG